MELKNILKYGITIKHKSLDDCIKISRNQIELSFELLWMYQCLDKNRDIYYFYKTFDNRDALDSNYFKIQKYLRDLLKLMRLFKEGNIQMPISFSYIKKNNRPTMFSTLLIHDITIFSNNYSLETTEIDDLQVFLNDFDLSIKEKSLNLALENYELSYEVKNVNLQFLTLMNALEILLKPSSAQTDLTYRLSRNAAVILGENEDDSYQIYKELNCLYAIRSSIVHVGEPKECEKTGKKRKTLNDKQMTEQTRILRDYVRCSIKEMNFIMKKEGKSKDQVLKMLNVRGFGDRLWRED